MFQKFSKGFKGVQVKFSGVRGTSGAFHIQGCFRGFQRRSKVFKVFQGISVTFTECQLFLGALNVILVAFQRFKDVYGNLKGVAGVFNKFKGVMGDFRGFKGIS